jgi:hypothetical protein
MYTRDHEGYSLEVNLDWVNTQDSFSCHASIAGMKRFTKSKPWYTISDPRQETTKEILHATLFAKGTKQLGKVLQEELDASTEGFTSYLSTIDEQTYVFEIKSPASDTISFIAINLEANDDYSRPCFIKFYLDSTESASIFKLLVKALELTTDIIMTELVSPDDLKRIASTFN